MIVNRIRHLGSRRAFRRFSSQTNSLESILEQVRQGTLQPVQAEALIRNVADASQTPEDTLKSFANLDHSRSSRTGFPEAVFAAGKTPDQVARILDDMARNLNEQIRAGTIDDSQRAILATRLVDFCCQLEKHNISSLRN
jgi:NCAIR mutase (PurE)-related protein